MELDSFKEWLINEKGLKTRSARDVASRARRVNKVIDIDINSPYETIVATLDKNEEFNKFSVYVKPQIKRAVKLYKEFQQKKK